MLHASLVHFLLTHPFVLLLPLPYISVTTPASRSHPFRSSILPIPPSLLVIGTLHTSSRQFNWAPIGELHFGLNTLRLNSL